MSKELGQPIAFGCTTLIVLGAAACDQIPSRMMKASGRLKDLTDVEHLP